MNKINVIITGNELADELKKYFQHHNIKHLRFLKCRGFSCKFNFMEFLGAEEVQKSMLAFEVSKEKGRAISRFIRKYFNYKNNGIMFALNGEEMSDNVLLAAIVSMGSAEKVVDVVRKKASAGATILDARGAGSGAEEFFGVEIGSGKEVVLSAISREFLGAVQSELKENFKDDKTDLVSFVLPISDFDKLHQDK